MSEPFFNPEGLLRRISLGFLLGRSFSLRDQFTPDIYTDYEMFIVVWAPFLRNFIFRRSAVYFLRSLLKKAFWIAEKFFCDYISHSGEDIHSTPNLGRLLKAYSRLQAPLCSS